MRLNLTLHANVSRTSFVNRKSFEKLDTMPTTVFQYYFQLQVKDLHIHSPETELIHWVSRNSSFKRFKRKEWESLSLSKRRIYNALYFHFTGLNYRTLGHEEVARRLEIPIPPISEYLLFRNKFKSKFDLLWEEQRNRDLLKRTPKLILRSKSSGAVKSPRFSAACSIESDPDLTIRFHDMCRECRRTWREKVSSLQKAEIGEKLREQRRSFRKLMDKEIEVLDSLQSLLVDRLKDANMLNSGTIDLEKGTTQRNTNRLAFLVTHSDKE
ncbi:LAFA_0E09406g1_1 [Lachancea sp. 'fantastica']|nr:LAFA_0E09406g1_1 [Lachancea sp. 'fantastica']